jgi:crossover junction endodeoxyribonuclease RuvC
MSRILGIDPGSRLTGYGVIDCHGQRAVHVASGFVHANSRELAARLRVIFDEMTGIVRLYQPREMVVEQVFVHRNVSAALKLGQARGVAVLAGLMQGLPLYEYTPREIKKAVIGNGNAGKDQVQYMIKTLLSLSQIPQSDAADALGVALCHAHTRQTLWRIEHARGRWASSS